SGPADAAARAVQLRAGTTPAVIAVELDAERLSTGFGWAAQLVAAVAPTAVWAAVDAGRKVEDLRAELAPLGSVDALVGSGAARPSSGATVLDVEMPVALLDGRPATTGTWAGLLLDAVRAGR